MKYSRGVEQPWGRGWLAVGTAGVIRIALALGFLLGAVSWNPIIEPAAAQTATTERIASLRASNTRWIEVNVTTQRLIAWEGNTPVYAVIVSTGRANHATPTGSFAIQSKHRTARMRGDDYDVPDVPFTLYYSGNYAIHGAYWHRRFGTPVSHGCVNVAVDHAEWLFHWAAIGTPVVVRD